MNLTSLDRSETDGLPSDESPLYEVNVLKGKFPEIPNSGMDASQMSACKRMLTSSLAIVQGPPGTGKTFTSVSAIKALLDNVGPDEPPIIIAAQTNHALDQLMNHIMAFEEKVVRLGGRCAKENVEILKRTLYNLRTTTTDAPKAAGLRGCRIALGAKVQEIQTSLEPLLLDDLISEDTFFKYGLISESQKDKLNVKGWVDANLVTGPDGGAPSASIRACKSLSSLCIPFVAS
jgi:helicase required for RNAi-mediated heterochromatin assembly 1